MKITNLIKPFIYCKNKIKGIVCRNRMYHSNIDESKMVCKKCNNVVEIKQMKIKE